VKFMDYTKKIEQDREYGYFKVWQIPKRQRGQGEYEYQDRVEMTESEEEDDGV
jgi:hypothetical protein